MAAPISRDAAGACRALAGTAPRSSASVCERTESVYRHAPSRLSLGTAPVLSSSLRCRKSLFFPGRLGRSVGWVGLCPGVWSWRDWDFVDIGASTRFCLRAPKGAPCYRITKHFTAF